VDLGCGNGYLAALLAERGHDVTGLEASVDGIEQARVACRNVRFERASVYDDVASVIGTGYDVALATEVIEHLDRPRELFRAALSVVKAGGLVICTTPYHGYLKNAALALVPGALDRHYSVQWDGGHIKFFSQKTLTTMAAAAGVRHIRFRFAGRLPLLWKSMILIGER
jgi:2-polyprenyl-3-methyl-5-hydroxy-6-metoxy-1,4-benzoquinol methylase